MSAQLDTTRVLCKRSDIVDGNTRGFEVGDGDWPLRGLLVRLGDAVHAFVNYCPHAGHPLNFMPDRFLTPDGKLIICMSHGAMFEKATGYCVMGPCSGESLRRVQVSVAEGYVMLEAGVDIEKLKPPPWW
jgi:nitrite reductase/ring-hydroxylating ferredoxin subunit